MPDQSHQNRISDREDSGTGSGADFAFAEVPCQEFPYQEVATRIRDFQENSCDGPVVDYHDPISLKGKLTELHSNSEPGSWDSIWQAIDFYLSHSVKTSHPQYFNQLWAGHSQPALVGSVFEAVANTSMYTYEVAPVATLIETEMLNRMKAVFGFKGGEAQITTGGSNSNYLALLLALHKKFPELKTRGLQGLPAVSVFVSDDSHYSMDKAMVMAGVGLDSLVRVPVDVNGSMDVAELGRLLKESESSGRVPVSIVGTAGTTVRGAFDPFSEIVDLAKRHQCWFHVDGAWGGAVAFSEHEKRNLKGSELADSLSWDAHKMLGLPLMCSMVFVRESGHFDKVCNLGDTSYIFHTGTDENETRDLGPYSLQCGRRVDTLKLWLEYLFYGVSGFAQRVDNFMALSRYAEERIASEPTLELQSHRWINNICFRSKAASGIDHNEFNKKIREHLYHSGESLVNIAYIQEDLTIRLIICNKDVTQQDIQKFFDNWLQTARLIELEYQQCA